MKRLLWQVSGVWCPIDCDLSSLMAMTGLFERKGSGEKEEVKGTGQRRVKEVEMVQGAVQLVASVVVCCCCCCRSVVVVVP